MKQVVSSIISRFQGAFVHGRQIIDGSLIANECIDSRLTSGTPGVVYKIDIEKAYDFLSWGFLDYMLARMGFGLKWRKWIKTCVSTASFSIMVNGSPAGFFRSKRGPML